MTEDEAKTKWCPHAIASHTNPRQHNGEVWLHNCIGSACMAWRWHGEPTEKREFYTMGKRPDGDGWRCTLSDAGREGFQVKSRWERDVAREGHCGLAGKP